MNLPLLWKVKEFPFSSALRTSVVMGVHPFPARFFFRCVPYNLWVWTDKGIITPFFQLFSIRCIYNLIFFPIARYEHNNLHSADAFASTNLRFLHDFPYYTSWLGLCQYCICDNMTTRIRIL